MLWRRPAETAGLEFGGSVMIEIRELRRRDYKKTRRFAIQGMHLDWYMDSRWILSLYSKYF